MPSRSTAPVAHLSVKLPEAAAMVSVSPGTFEKLVGEGKMPQPIMLRGCKVWRVASLDTALAALENEAGEANEFAA